MNISIYVIFFCRTFCRTFCFGEWYLDWKQDAFLFLFLSLSLSLSLSKIREIKGKAPPRADQNENNTRKRANIISTARFIE